MVTKKATKNTAKKAPVKKSTKPAPKHAKLSGISRHIGLRPEERPFITFRVTRETVYWLVLGAVVIVYTVWLLQLQMEIQSIYDSIDKNVAFL